MTSISYAPIALANTFVKRYGEANPLTQMKLQKLAYYAYGWWLTKHQEPLLTKGPEVWQYGPVFSELYYLLRSYGSEAIRSPVRPNPFSDAPEIKEEDVGFVDWIWESYGRFSAFDLSDMTHAPGTPWQQVAKEHNYRLPFHTEIPNEVMADYFKKLANEGRL